MMIFDTLFAPVKKVLEVPFKRLVKFAIKTSLGKYLRNDLKVEQFCVDLASGVGELKDLEIDTEALDWTSLPLDRVHVELVRVEAFGGLRVCVKGVLIEISTDNQQPSTSQNDNQSDAEKQSNRDGKPAQHQDQTSKEQQREEGEEEQEEDLSQAAQDGLQTLGKWLEDYASALQIKVQDVRVRFKRENGECVEFTLDTMELCDVTDDSMVSMQQKAVRVSSLRGAVGNNNRWEQFLLVSDKTEAIITLQEDLLSSIHVILPWIHVQMVPRMWETLGAVLNPLLWRVGDDDTDKEHIEKPEARTSQRNTEEETGLTGSAISMEDSAEFFDAQDSMSNSMLSIGSVQNSEESDVSDKSEGEDDGSEADAKASVRVSQKGHVLSFQVEVLKWQVELLYKDPVGQVSGTFQSSDPMGEYVKGWVHQPGAGPLDSLLDTFTETPSLDNDDRRDRLVVRLTSSFLKGEICSTNGSRGSLQVGKYHMAELLKQSPLDPTTGMVHLVVSMDTPSTQAFRINFVHQASLVVRLAPLLISWDNGLADRLIRYFPVESEESCTRKDQPRQEKQTTRADRRADSHHGNEKEKQGAKMSFDLLSPKALVVIRVPESLEVRNRWKKEALILDMTDMDAKSAEQCQRSATTLADFFSTLPARAEPLSAIDAQEEFYRYVEQQREIVWQVAVDFSYSRACIVPVLTGSLDWSIGEDKPWALMIGASADHSGSRVFVPRISMCVRKPLVWKSAVVDHTREALQKAKAFRRAFKNRVHQRRAPGHEGTDENDPAGDHDLDKDQDPPLHTVLETVISHGFATADSSVRLRCPTATMKLDRRQYHCMNAVLQLIVSTIPSFTQPCKANEEEKQGAEEADLSNMLAEKQGDLTASGDSHGFWDDTLILSPTPGLEDFPDVAEDEALLMDQDDSESTSRIVDESMPVSIFFQMESNEGQLEIGDHVSDSDIGYLFNYQGLQVSVVDARTMIECVDMTLSECVKTREQAPCTVPVFHTTKWGRHSLSPPILQVFVDTSLLGPGGSNTKIINMTVENLLLRYSPTSTWLQDLSQFFGGAAPEGSVSLSHLDENDDPVLEGQDLSDKAGCCSHSNENVRQVSYTELTVEFFDSVIDYRPTIRTKQGNGMLLSVGLLRLSSNIAVTLVRDQSFHVTARDLSLYVSNDAPTFGVNDHLCGAELASATASPFCSVDEFTVAMLYAKMASLDMLELFIRSRNDVGGEGNESQPLMNYEVSVPHLSLYTCFDSLGTLQEIVTDLTSELSVKNERSPSPTTVSKSTRSREPSQSQLFPQQVDEQAQRQQGWLETRKEEREESQVGVFRDKAFVEKGEEPDEVMLDGFFAVEEIVHCGKAKDKSFSFSSVSSSSSFSQAAGFSAGRWYETETRSVQEVLLWEDGENGVQEIELDEVHTAAEEFVAERQVEEDFRAAQDEQEMAMRDYQAMVRAECPELDAMSRLEDFSIGSGKVVGDVLPRVVPNVSSDNFQAQGGGWYPDSQVRIYPHYMGISYEAGPGSHVPTPESLAARLECSTAGGVRGSRVKKGRCETRIVLRDMTVNWFLFGGCDWNTTAEIQQKRKVLKKKQEDRERRLRQKGQKKKKPWRGRQRFGAFKDSLFGVDRGDEQDKMAQSGKSGRRKRHRLAGRLHDNMIQIVLSHISGFLDRFEEPAEKSPCGHVYESLAVAVRDFVVTDHIASSEINQMVCEWVSELQHPRITGSSMLRLAVEKIRKEPRDTSRVRLSMLPVKVNLDQDAIDFVMQFLSIEPLAEQELQEGEAQSPLQRRGNKDNNSPPTRQGHTTKDQKLDDWMNHDEESDVAEAEDQVTGGNENEESWSDFEDEDIVFVEDTDWRIENVDIRAFKVRVDYRPKRVSLEGLMQGDRMAVLNLFSFEGLEVALRRVQLYDVRGWNDLMQRVQSSWMLDFSGQKHKCLAGVSFPPLNTVANLGSGLTNLVLMPLEQYQRDGRVVHGIRRGALAFVRTVAIEALGTISKAAMTAQTLLEHARDVISPSPLVDTTKGGGWRIADGSIGSPGGATGSSSGSGTGEGAVTLASSRIQGYGATQPKDFTEGLEKARDSFTREVKRAAFVLVALPLEDFQRSGTTTAIKSMLRGVPIAVLRAGIGASMALSNTFIGLRNTVDPDGHVEAQQKYKPST